MFRSRYVDIVNNTTYWNGQVVGYPELFANTSQDIKILNNIIIPRPAGKVTSNNKNKGNIIWDYNLYPQKQNLFIGEHDIIADPLFKRIDPNPTKGDFTLATGSKGLNSGTSELAQKTDLIGHPRPAGKARDRGAFEQ